MKKLSTLLGSLTAVIALCITALVMAAEVPADKASMTLELMPTKQGKVVFPHAKHAKEFKKNGAAITCKDCHHTLKAVEPGAGEKIEACTTCHAKAGEAEKDVGGKKAPAVATLKDGKAEMKSVIFHKTCLDGCHKQAKVEGKNLGACKTCHQK